MKKQLLLLVLILLPMIAHADKSGTCGENLTWKLNESTGTLTIEGSGAMEDYISYLSVPWYGDREKISTVVISGGVTNIGDHAFCGCSDLTSVTIPNSVTSIGRSAFSSCYGLTSITIPNSVTSIDASAFYGCFGLTSVTIPNSVTSIDANAFRECSGLTSVTIPNSVTSIHAYAFYGCSGLTSVTIPNSVTSIYASAFYGCSGLTSVTIPNSVTSIGNAAFAGCSGLTFIEVESGNTEYDSRNSCNAIIETANNTLLVGCKSTVIPNSVTKIGSNAFELCSSLTSVTIPNSVTSIGLSAFGECTGLTSITIGNSVTSIGYGAFGGCRIESILTRNSKTAFREAFSDRTYQHAMLYIPEGTWGEAVYDGGWYMFNNIREIAMMTDDLSSSRAYTLMDTNTFGYAVYDGTSDEVKMVKAFYSINERDPNNCWLIKTQAGKKYLFNLGAKKYAVINADGRITLTANETAIEVREDDNSIILGADTNHQWGFVKNNSQPDITGVTAQMFNSEQTANSYFSLAGQRTQSSRKGLNIVRLNDGTTKKIIVK